MTYGFMIIISIIIIVFVMVSIFVLRKNQLLASVTEEKNDILNNTYGMKDRIQTLTKENEYLKRVKDVDDTIFQFIRCINVPKSPTCKSTIDDNSTSSLIPSKQADVCRSRQIDCNKYKLLLARDPVGIERMKIATDLYTQTGQTKNPSDLTYPVVSGWFF